jgi:CBS domain-containing protein
VLKAQDIMTTYVTTIQASALVGEAIGLMKTRGVHALVIEPQGEERGYGIVTEADIAYKAIAQAQDPKALTVADIMTKPCITIKPDMSVKNIAQLFADHQIHRAPVVKEKLLGIVSVSDILQRGRWWQD